MLLDSTNSLMIIGIIILTVTIAKSPLNQSISQSITPSLLLAIIEIGKLPASVLLIRLPFLHKTNQSINQSISQSVSDVESESDRETLLPPRNKQNQSVSQSISQSSDVESRRTRSTSPSTSQSKIVPYRPTGLIGSVQSIIVTINQSISGLLFSSLVLAVLTSAVGHLSIKLIDEIGLIDWLIVISISCVLTGSIIQMNESRSIKSFNQSVNQSTGTLPMTVLAAGLVMFTQLNINQFSYHIVILCAMTTLLFTLQSVVQSINQPISQFRFGIKHSNQLVFAAGVIVNLWIYFLSQTFSATSRSSVDQMIDLLNFQSISLIGCLVLCSLYANKVQSDRSFFHASFLLDCSIIMVVFLLTNQSISQSFSQSTSQSVSQSTSHTVIAIALLLCGSYARIVDDSSVSQSSGSQSSKLSLRLVHVLMAVGCIMLFTSLDQPINQSINQSLTQSKSEPVERNLTEAEVESVVHSVLPMVTYQPLSNKEDFTIVIPSYHGHVGQLVKYLISMKTFCDGCTDLPVRIITGINEKPLFTTQILLNPEIGPFYQSIVLLTLPEISHYWQNRTCDDAKDGNSCIRSRHIHQSLKKMYGCLSVKTRYCWVSDSESVFVRPTSVKELLQDYIDSPKIITSTWLREHYSASNAARQALGITSRFGWLLEYYMWVFDRSIFAEVESLFRARYPMINDLPESQELFIEVVYYAYLLHHQRRYPQYEILDTTDMYGPVWWSQFTNHYPRFDWGVIEDARVVYDEKPELRNGINEMWRKYGLKTYKSHHGEHQCNAFLDSNPGVVLLLSEQPNQVYESALKGRYLLPEHKGYENRTAFKPGDEKK